MSFLGFDVPKPRADVQTVELPSPLRIAFSLACAKKTTKEQARKKNVFAKLEQAMKNPVPPFAMEDCLAGADFFPSMGVTKHENLEQVLQRKKETLKVVKKVGVCSTVKESLPKPQCKTTQKKTIGSDELAKTSGPEHGTLRNLRTPTATPTNTPARTPASSPTVTPPATPRKENPSKQTARSRLISRIYINSINKRLSQNFLEFRDQTLNYSEKILQIEADFQECCNGISVIKDRIATEEETGYSNGSEESELIAIKKMTYLGKVQHVDRLVEEVIGESKKRGIELSSDYVRVLACCCVFNYYGVPPKESHGCCVIC